MKKQIFLAVMAATSLGSLQAASSYLSTTFAVLNNLSTKDKVILIAGATALGVAAYSLQQKEKLVAVRIEVAKERAALATENNNEDKKYALIQRISKTQQAYDSFITQALYFYRMHAKETQKAQLKLHFEKATQNIQKLEALMACTKQTLHPDGVDFEKDMKSFNARIQVFTRISTELTNALKALKKDSPAIL